MGTVALRNIRKSFGTVKVLHGIDLDVDDGEFVVLVGPSGCGKSTLLRTLAGLDNASSGDVMIDGLRVNELAPKQRDIAMVFQNYALYPHMTVAQNMGFSLRLAKAPKEEISRKVGEAAEILGLGELLDRYPRQLSGGQRQRVAMGRAIVRNPKVFLFDEPLSNLDAKLRVQMRSEIKQLHHRLSATIVYVTHDQIEAMTMADKIVVMRGGHIEQVGAPLDLYDRPANTFVAGFIGSPAMNFLPARLEGAEAVLSDGTRLPVAVGTANSLAGGSVEVTLGVRPEHFEFAARGIGCKVVLVEPTGSETQVMAEVDGHTITATSRERRELRPGETVFLAVSPDRIHLFDARTGTSLRHADAQAPAMVP